MSVVACRNMRGVPTSHANSAHFRAQGTWQAVPRRGTRKHHNAIKTWQQPIRLKVFTLRNAPAVLPLINSPAPASVQGA